MATGGHSQITCIKRKSRLEKKISLQSTTNARTGDTLHRDEQHSTVKDGVTEFDSSSDEESCEGCGGMAGWNEK